MIKMRKKSKIGIVSASSVVFRTDYIVLQCENGTQEGQYIVEYIKREDYEEVVKLKDLVK